MRPAVDGDAADTVVLVVSEVVTNALRHGGGTYALRLTAHPSAIEVAVEDPSPEHPRPRTPNLHYGTGGFGWHMVNDLAHTTITPHPRAARRSVCSSPGRSGGGGAGRQAGRELRCAAEYRAGLCPAIG
ncbi:ATP-binding protein [Streptomyces sp. NBC_00859]|uniref:ATP-binding protein n=1 Tax=Streptomyces sp. NBC_00859 TaxID=2903682 RepID=UPI00386F9646